MNILILFVYNRPNVLQMCLNTMLPNAGIEFDKILIFDDGSDNVTKQILNDYGNKYNDQFQDIKLEIIANNSNKGYGVTTQQSFEKIFKLKPKYVFRIEQDYIFRKNWALESLELLQHPQFEKSIAISGYSHYDYYSNTAKQGKYITDIVKYFGKDIDNRQCLFKSFFVNTATRKIKVQGVSHTCGTLFINWENFMKLFNNNNEFLSFMPKLTENNLFNDGFFSSLISYKWIQKYKDYIDIDLTKEFAIIDVCDKSLANHIGGAGINMRGIEECTTISEVGSPIWFGSN